MTKLLNILFLFVSELIFLSFGRELFIFIFFHGRIFPMVATKDIDMYVMF